MMKMKKIKITVAGVPYMIATDNAEEYAYSLAEEINAEIDDIMSSSVGISPSQATVLALLNYADTAKKAKEECESMKFQLKEYLADAAQAKSERDMLKRELAKIKKNGQGDF
jgi:cell division protein ZapA